MALDNRGGVGLTVYAFTNPDTMATAYMISGGLNGGYVQETVEMSFVGNALLYMLDIALCFGGIVNLLPLFAMGPVGIVIGVGLVILASIAINAAFNALGENYRMMDAYIRGESNGDEIVEGFVWNSVLTVTALGLSQCIDLGIEIGRAHAAERYLNGVIGPRLTEGLLSEGLPPSQVAKAVKQMRNLGYTDDFIRELADNISAEQLIRMSSLSQKGLGQELLDTLLRHSKKLGNYSDDLIWQLERAGNYTDDILKLVDDYGEAFTRQIGTDDLSRLGRLVNEGLTDDVVDAVIKHADNFADYSDNTIRKIAESGGNAERILTQIDNYAKDFTEDLTAGQLKRLDDILEQGVTPEQFEVLVKHGKQIENYTDEIVGLWRNYSGNGDDFLKLVDEFGDEFVEAFQKSGDEAVDKFLRILENATDSPYLTKPVQGGILNIGAGTRPIENAYNIDINPTVEGVYQGTITNLSEIPTSSQSKVIMHNPYNYDALSPEVGRVLESGGTVEITGGLSNKWFNRIYNLTEEQLAEMGYEIVSKGEALNVEPGYTTSGEEIKGTVMEIILRKK